MGTTDKFIVKLKKLPKDISFKELHNFLVGIKFNLSFRVRGSHYIYYVEENGEIKDLLVIPNHGIVKVIYIKKVVDLIDERGINDEK